MCIFGYLGELGQTTVGGLLKMVCHLGTCDKWVKLLGKSIMCNLGY